MTPPHYLKAYLTELLYDLEAVEESLPHHPEENALAHSLQTFELARNNTDNPLLISAALFHDIGKPQGISEHAAHGATLLNGYLPTYVVWLVEHHMDLLYAARQTERAHQHTEQLKDLKQLRQWDKQARVPRAPVCTVEFSVDFVCQGMNLQETHNE